MSFTLNPQQGGPFPAPDYVTNPMHLLEICRTLNDVFGGIEGHPYYSILLEFRKDNTETAMYQEWIKAMVRQYEHLEIYEIDGLILFAIPKDDNKEQDLRLLVIKKRT